MSRARHRGLTSALTIEQRGNQCFGQSEIRRPRHECPSAIATDERPSPESGSEHFEYAHLCPRQSADLAILFERGFAQWTVVGKHFAEKRDRHCEVDALALQPSTQFAIDSSR